MNKSRNLLNKSIEVICMILLVFMVVLGTWQIITRYVLNNPSTVSVDFTNIFICMDGITWISICIWKKKII